MRLKKTVTLSKSSSGDLIRATGVTSHDARIAVAEIAEEFCAEKEISLFCYETPAFPAPTITFFEHNSPMAKTWKITYKWHHITRHLPYFINRLGVKQELAGIYLDYSKLETVRTPILTVTHKHAYGESLSSEYSSSFYFELGFYVVVKKVRYNPLS